MDAATNTKEDNYSDKDGIAHIKPKYIVPAENIPKEDDTQLVHTESQENKFPNKKKKTGRNHKRPKLIKEPPQKKLCRNLWCILPGESPGPERCPYENCCFSHDVQGFLEHKPQDVGEKCHNFSVYGFCPYGLVCRYGNSHIESLGSVVDPEKKKIYDESPPVRNYLKKELQVSLRKKTYDFSKAQEVLKEILPHNKALDSKNKECSNPSHVQSSGKEESLSSDVVGNGNETQAKRLGPANDEDLIPLRPVEKKKIEWRDKLYLAPLTTLGNLPYRRVCKRLGADVTCSEMALATCLLQGSPSEWALVKRHSSEDLFGVQLCGSHTDAMVKCAHLLNQEIEMDFVDINMGCPIDLIYKQGGGSALMRRSNALSQMVEGMTKVLSCPLTLKMRTAVYKDTKVAHTIIEKAKSWGIDLFTVHGRSKEQRYLKLADWDYIKSCAEAASPIPLFGNGDVLTYDDYIQKKTQSDVAGIMIARGALMKPWIFTEIKEQRQWDISSSERMDILREFVNNGLEHWGSDTEGIEKTRRFLLEWLSFLYRYIPVGILEHPQKINQRPAVYVGRDDLETLMASNNVKDWIKISEMLLGPVPNDFAFLPKHKANSWG